MRYPHQCFKVISSFKLLLMIRRAPYSPPPCLSRPETKCTVSCVSVELCRFDACWKCHVAGLVCALDGFWMQCSIETEGIEDSGNRAAAGWLRTERMAAFQGSAEAFVSKNIMNGSSTKLDWKLKFMQGVATLHTSKFLPCPAHAMCRESPPSPPRPAPPRPQSQHLPHL